MQKISRTEALTWITQNTDANPTGLTTAFAKQFRVSRAAAATFIKHQTEAGFLVKTGSSTRPIYHLGEERHILKSYSLPGIDEANIWEKDFSPYLNLSDNVRNICSTGFTEMVNNANDHSEGSMLKIYFLQDYKDARISIFDNGIGIFQKISDALLLPDMKLALLELTKGKFTTDTKNHSGEGIFFTSRAFDYFVISANKLRFNHHHAKLNDRLEDDYFGNQGTAIHMRISLQSTRTMREVYDRFTSDPEELNFDTTVIPVRLARLGTENLVSRSQAKRLLQRIDKFRFVELDFTGVEDIGQAFADEIFRVYANQHPEIKIEATNITPEVASMINRAQKTQR